MVYYGGRLPETEREEVSIGHPFPIQLQLLCDLQNPPYGNRFWVTVFLPHPIPSYPFLGPASHPGRTASRLNTPGACGGKSPGSQIRSGISGRRVSHMGDTEGALRMGNAPPLGINKPSSGDRFFGTPSGRGNPVKAHRGRGR